MNSMFLSEMQEKEVISIENGLNYGHITDAKITDDGKIISFIVENKKIFKKPFSGSEIHFSISDIAKIGKDVILVKV